MFTKEVHVEVALDIIRTARPACRLGPIEVDLTTEAHTQCPSPNNGFLEQLAIFQEASYRLSRWDKSTRMFYLERAVREVMSMSFIFRGKKRTLIPGIDGDGSDLPLHMLAKFPRSPGDSAPATPGGPKRRIRCRLCRLEDLSHYA